MATRLWGREHELAIVRARLTDALGGHPSVVVLGGEPGIGKTSLLRELMAMATEAGAEVLWGRGIVTGDAPPFSLWQQITSVPTPIEADRFAAYEAVRNAVLAHVPSLVVIDDLQWADASSLAGLTYLVRRMNSERLLVAASLRTDDPADAWVAAGSELLAEHRVERIDVTGLNEEDSRHCLRAACVVPLAEHEVGRAIALSRGNPFYLTELGRAWTITPGARGVPGGVLDVLGHRLARLPNATQEFLLTASVLGDKLDIAVVAHCLGLATMECLPAVQSALDAQLLERDSPGTVRFTHGLLRTALVERIPVQRLVALHQRAAEAIEELHATSLRRHLGELARHHAAAAVGGAAERRAAVDWAARAAEAAMEEHAYEDAAARYDLALECAGHALDEQTRIRLVLGRARANFAAGRFADARSGCRAAAASLAPEDAALWADLALTLDAVGERAWDRDVREWCQRALPLADPGDASLRARLMARLADALVYDGRWDEAASYAGDALELATGSGDDEALAAALRARQLACSGPEFHDERVQLAERMTELGVSARRPDIEMWGRLWRIDALWERAELAAIAGELTKLQWAVEQLGSPTAQWHELVTRAALAQARGEFADAKSAGDEGFGLMTAMGHEAGFGAYMSLLGALGHHFGHQPMSLGPPPGVAPAEGEMRAELFMHLGPAYALAESGNLEAAATLYSRPGPPQSWTIPPFFRVPALHCAASIAIRIGRADDVAFLGEQLEHHRGGHIVGGGGVASYHGPAELVLGRCAAALGDLQAAERDLRSALQVATDKGLPSFVVETSCELADVLIARRRRSEALSMLHSVAPVAERLGMTPWVDRIKDAIGATEDRLTAREREVARLVADGLSNREIAGRLVVSERTAANHVQHVLTKLGFVRRAEIAAWLSRA